MCNDTTCYVSGYIILADDIDTMYIYTTKLILFYVTQVKSISYKLADTSILKVAFYSVLVLIFNYVGLVNMIRTSK